MGRIQDIEAAEPPVELQIRVIRKWKHHMTNQELCYLFVDIHGDAIEATADETKEAYFDSKLILHECYTISNYIAIPSRKYKPVVPHHASIRLGEKVLFQPIPNTTIPAYYYNFATYDQLEIRKADPKPLTDYIGRIEKIFTITTRACRRIKKVIIQDDRSNLIEITFWSENIFSYENEEAMGQLLAVTSTVVTEYLQKLQLESTPATVAVINPQIPNLQAYINRFKQIAKSCSPTTEDSILTITDVLRKYHEDNKQTRFTCKASIIEILPNRKWYYVKCSNCPKKLYLQKGYIPKFVCEDHGIIPEPTFMYCVNTIIGDETEEANAIFFNEAMTEMLDISCKSIIVNHGHSDPLIIPPQIHAIRGTPAILDVSMKKDGSMIVNNASKQITFMPITPNNKSVPPKRQLQQPSAYETLTKHRKL